MSMSRFFSKRFGSLEPYVPGEQPQNRKYIKLNTNESPFQPSPEVIKAINGEAEALNLYPDPECGLLCEELADYYDVSKENIFVGNGSDEVLAFLFMAFCDKDTGACYPSVSYGFYRVYCELCCISGRAVPLNPDFTINPADYFNSGRTVFIANPNAPTGIALSLNEIELILKANRKNVVVIDEAYVDFGGESAIKLLPEYDNLAVVRTFSKSRNMAGARLGFCIGGKDIIGDLNTIKFSFNPYNVDRLALAAGRAAVKDDEYFKKCVYKIVETRERTVSKLESAGFSVLPSKANFIFAKKSGISGGELYRELKARGILVRYFDKPELKDYVRITIGADEQMQELVAAVCEICV